MFMRGYRHRLFAAYIRELNEENHIAQPKVIRIEMLKLESTASILITRQSR